MMTDPTIAAWSIEDDLLFQLRQLRGDNARMAKEIYALHEEIGSLHKMFITRAEQIVGLQDEIRNLTGEEE